MKKEENKRALAEQSLDQVSGGVDKKREYPHIFAFGSKERYDKKAQELYGKNYDELTEKEKMRVRCEVTTAFPTLKYGGPHMVGKDM